MVEFLPQWTRKSQGTVDSLILQATSGNTQLDTPEERLSFLRNARRNFVDEYRAKAQTAGIHPDVYSTQIPEAVAPIDNLIKTAESMAGDQGLLMNAFRNAQQLQSDRILTEALGPLGVNREFQKQAFASLGSTFFDAETFQKTVEGLTNISNEGLFSGLDFMPDIPGSPKASAALGTTGSAVSPSVIDTMSRNISDNPKYFDVQMGTSVTLIDSADPSSPQGRVDIFTHFSRIAALSEATPNVLGQGYLNSVFSDKNLRLYATATQGTDQASVDLKNTLTYFSAKQIRRNQQLISDQLDLSLIHI